MTLPAVERVTTRTVTVYVFERQCARPGCGEWFDSGRSQKTRRFCSKRCRNASWRHETPNQGKASR